MRLAPLVAPRGLDHAGRSLVRWLCTACQVEWSTTGEDHGPCWFCDGVENVKETFEVPWWAWGYRDTEPRQLTVIDEWAPAPDWDAIMDWFHSRAAS